MRCSEYLPGCTRYGKRNECSNRISTGAGSSGISGTRTVQMLWPFGCLRNFHFYIM